MSLRQSSDIEIPPYLSRLSIDELWRCSTGHPEVSIALLDGYVDLDHPTLQGADLQYAEGAPSREFVLCQASSLHGTAVASILWGRPDSTVAGVAPGCKGWIVPIFHDSGDGSGFGCDQGTLAAALDQARELGADIINISGGELMSARAPVSHELSKAVARCAEAGVLIVAAAGNDGCDCVHIPGVFPTALAVGATDLDGVPLAMSNWGEPYSMQGILAPGESILGAVAGTSEVLTFTGTSFAAPIVSGVVGLLSSVRVSAGCPADPASVRRAILESASSCHPEKVPEVSRCLAGQLNPRAALSLVLSGDSTMSELQQANEIQPSCPSLTVSPETNVSGEASGEASATEWVAASGGADEAESVGITSVVEDSPMSAAPPTTGIGASVWPSAASDIWQSPSGVQPSDCGCGGKDKNTDLLADRLVFALGLLSYDFGTQENFDWFAENMPKVEAKDAAGKPILDQDKTPILLNPDPYNHLQMLEYLNNQPAFAANLIWIVTLDSVPVYAVRPDNGFSDAVYSTLRRFLREQLTEDVERESFPGVLHGTARLLNGMNVPVIAPDLRGMFDWNVRAVLGQKEFKALTEADKLLLRSFLERIYYLLRNPGLTPQDRALNFTATQAILALATILDIVREDFKADASSGQDVDIQIDNFAISKSPICRPGADCWDVSFRFFDAANILVAKVAVQMTVDVAAVVPVLQGKIHSWRVI